MAAQEQVSSRPPTHFRVFFGVKLLFFKCFEVGLFFGD